MKILQICSSPSWGGMEMHLPILSEVLQRRNHGVFVVCSPGTMIMRDALSRGLRVFPLKIRGYFDPFAISKLAGFIRDRQIDLIHSHYSKDLWTIVPAVRFAKRVPVILMKHIGTRFPKKDFLHQRIYREVSHIIANSEVIKRNLIATHPISEDKVSVIHLGIDLGIYNPRRFNRSRIRKELGIRSEELVIGIVGRLQRCKGYLEFLHMAKGVLKFHPNLKFLIVGGPSRGEEREAWEILQKVDELELGEKAIVTGYRKDVPRLMTAMDIFVFPSHAEAFGLVLIEAMAMRLPVVSSDCDGVLDIVKEGATGLLVPPRDVEGLTQAVLHLIQNPDARRSLGEAARRRVEERFSIEAMVERIEAVYQKALSDAGRD